MKLLLAMAVTAVPLIAQCTFTAAPTVFNVDAGSAASTLIVSAAITTGLGCRWTVASKVPWINPSPTAASGIGAGVAAWVVDRNPQPASRSGTITISGVSGSDTVVQTLTVNQAAAVCQYSIAPTSAAIQVGGGSFSLKVSSNCVWGAQASGWITFPAGAQGLFDGTLNYSVAANPCLTSRSGQVAVGYSTSQSQILTVTQDGSPNNLTVNPATAAQGPDAADGKVSVNIGAECFWSAYSDVSWLQITSSTGVYGPATLSYHMDANTSSARTGNLHLGPQLFTVTQSAAASPTPRVTHVESAASYIEGAVAPGEIVAIRGANLGPASGLALQLTPDNLSITKSLGGVQVLFDGFAAPLTYVSASQINAVVPYEVAGNPSTQMQVVNQGASSDPLSVPVQAAFPGIFTQDASGLGIGAIRNQDNSLNANLNRAARGSVIAIFCTGGGVTDPPAVDGVIATAASNLIHNVSVTIGGLPGAVQYSGAAPFLVAGVMQINAVIPDGVTPGQSVPISIQIGQWQSQAGVTVAVK